jgi:hypothetical protein
MFGMLKQCVGFSAAIGLVISSGCSANSRSGRYSMIIPPATPTPVPQVAVTTVTDLSVTRGSSVGGADIKITGTNLRGGETVLFGDVPTVGRAGSGPDLAGTTLYVTSPKHQAGVVDVVIAAAAGPVRIPQAFEFVDQQALDFNGKWGGYFWDGSDVWVEFVIRNDTLVSVSCTYDTTTTIATAAAVLDGSVSAQGPDDFYLSGRIVSPSQSTGTLIARACLHAGLGPWKANRID